MSGINNVPQGMVIRGQDVANPVLLVVHGGPGMPAHFLTRHHPTAIEDLFTVGWWDLVGVADVPGLHAAGEVAPVAVMASSASRKRHGWVLWLDAASVAGRTS